MRVLDEVISGNPKTIYRFLSKYFGVDCVTILLKNGDVWDGEVIALEWDRNRVENLYVTVKAITKLRTPSGEVYNPEWNEYYIKLTDIVRVEVNRRNQ